MIPAFGGKQEDRVAMGLPEGSQCRQGGSGQRDVAILGPFAAMDVDHHSLAVEITDLQVDRFADSQAEGVSRPDEGFQSERLASVDDLEDLRLGDHFGQRLDVVELGLIEHVPISGASRAIEELDPAQQHRLRARRNVLVNDLMQQELANIGFRTIWSGDCWQKSASFRTART